MPWLPYLDEIIHEIIHEMYDTKTFIQKVPVHGQVLVYQGYPGGPEFQAIEKFLVHASAFQCLQALLLLLLMNKKGLSFERLSIAY